jgi:predicted Zn-dependent peptidase
MILKRREILMIRDINTMVLDDGLELHHIHTDKFKTDMFGVYFKRPLTDREATMNSLLARMLKRGTKTYDTAQKLNVKLDDLYGSIIASSCDKYGEKHVLQIKIQFPNRDRIKDENITKEAWALLMDVVYNQLQEGDGFKAEYFEQEKYFLKQDILARINDKASYASDRMIEEMYEGEAFSVNVDGDIETLEKITSEELWDHYLELMRMSEIDFCFIGNVPVNEILVTVMEKESMFAELRLGQFLLPDEDFSIIDREVKNIEEPMDVNQGKLVMGFRTAVNKNNDLYESLMLGSVILGGGTDSKFFKNIREKESLCYYGYSYVDKFKGLLGMSFGIDFDKFDKTKELALMHLEEMKNGEFTEENIENARKKVVNSLRATGDFPNSFMNFFYNQILSRGNFDFEAMLKRIYMVNKETIVRAFENVTLDTVYFLKGKEE